MCLHIVSIKEGDCRMANYIGSIISLTLAIIVATNVLIPQVSATNTSGWSAGDVILFGVITTITVMGLVYGVATAFGLV